ncbi:MAG: transketolase [Parcubacteria group bacterium]|nr:MAG: transketolase [Parcubacteria group bacterium]
MLVSNWSQQNKLLKKSTRQGFGDALLALAKNNKNIVVVSADLAESTRVQKFGQKYPERFVEVGVAEQNAMGIAAGLALSGKIPFVASFGVFSPGRNWDQLRVSVCYSKANVKIVSTHTGLAVGEDGASHQALEDIALTRVLPNLTVIAPADYNETVAVTKAIAKHPGPVYLRLARQNSPVFTKINSIFKIGRAEILLRGNDITLIACGPVIYEALLAAHELAKKKIRVEIINCPTIKPLDKKTILRSVKKTKKLITLEDHQKAGGLGSALAEMLSQNYPVKSIIMGVNDTFGESGKPDQLWDKYGLSKKHIVDNIKKLLKK